MVKNAIIKSISARILRLRKIMVFMMMFAQSKPTSQPIEPTAQQPLNASQVHDRTEALALTEELKKHQRPFEKLRLAQAHEEKYREEAQSVETMLDMLESIALAETETGVIPPEERLILKKNLYQSITTTTPAVFEALEDESPTRGLEPLEALLKTTPLSVTDKPFLLELGTVIAKQLATQVFENQRTEKAFGLNQASEDKLVLCKYLQQLLDEVQKLRTENEALTTQLNHYQPAGLGLYRKQCPSK